MRNEMKVICVDLDGTLCSGECWTPKQCQEAESIKENIEKLRKIADKHIIIIYTARSDKLMSATFAWLHRNGIPFRAVSNNKVGADLYIDDKSINPQKRRWV